MYPCEIHLDLIQIFRPVTTDALGRYIVDALELYGMLCIDAVDLHVSHYHLL